MTATLPRSLNSLAFAALAILGTAASFGVTTAPARAATAPLYEAQLATPTVAAEPVATAKARAAKPAVAVETPTAVAAAPAPKLNLIQRMALSKVTRKMDKLMQKSGSVRQHDNTASTARGGISGNLRTGLILLLVGLLVGILVPIVGTIIAIIGLVFIILWLLDQA